MSPAVSLMPMATDGGTVPTGRFSAETGADRAAGRKSGTFWLTGATANGLPIADPPIAERTQPSPIDLPPCGFSRSGYYRRFGFLLRHAEASAGILTSPRSAVAV